MKDNRKTVQITNEAHEIVELAAWLERRTLIDFMTAAGMKEAERAGVTPKTIARIRAQRASK